MDLRAKYRGKNKKLNHKKITNYEELRATIQKGFPEAPQNFTIFYHEGQDEPTAVEDDDDYEMMVEPPRKIFILVKHEGEDPTEEIESSIIRPKNPVLNQSGIKETRDLLNQIEKKDEKQSSKVGQKEEEKVQKVEKKSEVKKEELPKVEEKHEEKKKKQQKSELKEEKPELKEEKPYTPKSKVEEEPVQKKQKPINHFIHKGTKCNFCSTPDIKGSRYKCVTCFQYDLCSDCYLNLKYKAGKEHKTKNHEFIEIEDDSFWNRVNFAHSLRKLFNPSYKLSQDGMEIGQWVSEDDLANNNLNFVKEIQRCSEEMTKKMVEGFEEWEKENEMVE